MPRPRTHCQRDGTSETFCLGTYRSGTVYHVIVLYGGGEGGGSKMKYSRQCYDFTVCTEHRSVASGENY